MPDTLNNLAQYHYVSLSVINRLKKRGVNVYDHLAVEKALLESSPRCRSWINGNPNQHGVKFPHCQFTERDHLACYCNKQGTCVACVADWDFGCKYFER